MGYHTSQDSPGEDTSKEMKWFLILLAIGLAVSDKLDRTYLPPPGANYAGGRPEDLDAPLELPHPPHTGQVDNRDILSGGDLGLKPLNYGDKIPNIPSTYYPVKVPTTTTSYAFSQTTTFPPESYETTALPINPVTGLPFNFDQSYQVPGINQGQLPTFGVNTQPGSVIQSQTPQSNDGNQGYDQPIDQPLNKFPGRNVIVPGEVIQIPGPNQGLTQNPVNNIPINRQQGVISTGTIGKQYLGQNVINPGGIIQYPIGQLPGKMKLLPSTALPQDINLQPTHGINYPGPEGSYNGQPINVAHQEPVNGEGQSTDGLRPIGSPTNNAPISGLIHRPERPQAVADRNAVILNYENVRYPNGYSYSYDTSNGIHADESGTVGNGTRAQGSYSYTGDDGKVYTVIYTADENGFQPRGDHLPTSPPIPEAIQKVIEQAARDEAAGIFDDGSYDEEKYGDKKYRNPIGGRRPQKQNLNLIINKLYGEQDNQVKPIVSITDVEENQNILLDKINKDFLNTETRGKPIDEQNMAKQPSKQESSHDSAKNVTIGNKRILRPNKSSPEEAETDELNKIGMQRNELSKPIAVVQRGPEGQDYRFQSDTYDKGIKDNNGPSDFSELGYNVPKAQKLGVRVDDGSIPSAAADFYSNTGNSNQFPGQKPKEYLIGSSNRYNQNQNDISQQPIIPQDNSGTLSIMDYLKYVKEQPSSNQQAETGYYYQKPNTTFSQTEYPTRFSTQGSFTTIRPDQAQTETERRKPLRPFITPDIYKQNDRTFSPTTRRPFTTIGVTSPAKNTYTEYDDDDYESDQDIDNGRVSSTKAPINKINVTSRPYQPMQTSGPQYIGTSQNTNIGQKEIYPEEHTSTLKPEIFFGPTTPISTSHSSRIGITDAPQSNKSYQRRPVMSQISESNPDVYNYGTTKPTGFSNTNLVPGYIPAFGSRASTPRIHTTQSYSTSTYRPSQDYSDGDLKGESQSTVHGHGFNPQPVSADSFHTGYHYEPPKTENSNSDFFNPRPVSSTLSPNTYQTRYPQGTFGFSNTTPVPSTPGRKGTFILTEPGSVLPTGTYQENYNGPSTPNLGPSSPGSTPVFGTLDFNPETSTGYEYGPVYSTSPSEPTFGPTTNTFIPSAFPSIPNQGYSTTYRPIQNIENGPLVDGFGRPIPTDQGPTFNGYTGSTQDPTQPPFQDSGYTGSQYDSRSTVGTAGPLMPLENITVNDLRPDFNGNIGSTAYPVPHDQPKVIGEDFSGPKQTQRYDPRTGYHY